MRRMARRARPHGEEAETVQMQITAVEVGRGNGDFEPVRLVTSRGPIDLRYYPAEGATAATVFVGGAGGGWDSPHDLYPRLCKDLPGDSIACLRVRYRHPAELGESALDALAGASFLAGEAIEQFAFVGWSFGGAVAIQAAAHIENARTVVTVATQSYGADAVADLAPDCSILLLHGTADRRLAP